MGVLRHVDAGYSQAIDFAAKHKIPVPMSAHPRD
jgi:urocanate hydratase